MKTREIRTKNKYKIMKSYEIVYTSVGAKSENEWCSLGDRKIAKFAKLSIIPFSFR